MALYKWHYTSLTNEIFINSRNVVSRDYSKDRCIIRIMSIMEISKIWLLHYTINVIFNHEDFWYWIKLKQFLAREQ